MFLISVILPKAPPSFENPCSIASAESTGSSAITPIIDHVPLLRNIASSLDEGAAKNADAVSCDGTVTSDAFDPVYSFISGSKGTEKSPGITMSGNISALILIFERISESAFLRQASRNPPVDAIVYSLTLSPVRKYPNRSGVHSAHDALSGTKGRYFISAAS